MVKIRWDMTIIETIKNSLRNIITYHRLERLKENREHTVRAGRRERLHVLESSFNLFPCEVF